MLDRLMQSAALWIALLCQGALAAPATQPAPIPMPSQYSDGEHLCIDLAARADAECTGIIRLGDFRSDRKFPFRAQLDGMRLRGQFTDDLGNTFPFTAQVEGEEELLVFRTGQTTYRLPRAQGNPGILRMMLDPVYDGYRIRELIKGGPAERAGVLAGDVITSVDGVSAAGKDSTALGLRGFVGTQVNITLRRENGGTVSLTLMREPFDRGLLRGFPSMPGGRDRRDAR